MNFFAIIDSMFIKPLNATTSEEAFEEVDASDITGHIWVSAEDDLRELLVNITDALAKTILGSSTMKITKAQQQALLKVFKRTKDSSYLAFRRTVLSGPGCIIVPFAGMWIGIEPDGHIHS